MKSILINNKSLPFFVVIICSIFMQNAMSAPSVKHQHNGRSHSHSLPKTGVKHFHKHMHNGRAHVHPYSAKVGFKHTHNKRPRAKAWAKAVKHDHGGRPHIHPLPKTGKKHNHSHKHGARSHVHALPANGSKHFHRVDKKPSNQIAKAVIKPNTNRNLNLQQQIDLVLTTPLDDIPEARNPAKKTQVAKVSKKTQVAKVSKKTQVKIKPRVNNNKPKATSEIKQNNVASNKTITPSKNIVTTNVKVTPRKSRKYKQTPEQITQSNRQFNLALRYQNGSGVQKNLPQAVNWYLRAAQNGHTNAQLKLATLYENGLGTKPNIQQAIHWYNTAAHNGNANAQVELGNRYAEGRNLNKNINEAIKWYKMAARQGNIRARANLNYLVED